MPFNACHNIVVAIIPFVSIKLKFHDLKIGPQPYESIAIYNHECGNY